MAAVQKMKIQPFDEAKMSSKGVASGGIMKHQNFVGQILCFGLGFLATQKFIISSLYSLFCIIPFFIALFSKNDEKRLAFFIIAICISVDNSLPGVPGTPSLVRYALYIVPIIFIFFNRKYDGSSLFISLIFIVYFISLSVLNSDRLSIDQFIRDFITVLLLSLAISSKSIRLHSVQSFLKVFLPWTIGFLFGELANAIIFQSAWYGDYLSYASTRWFVIIPVLYGLFYRKGLKFLPVYFAAFIVINSFGSRTIFITSLLSISIILAFRSRIDFRIGFILITAAVLFFDWLVDLEIFGEIAQSSKTLNIFYVFSEIGSSTTVVDAFRVLDPVRYYEHVAFFSRPFYEILFGSGLGVGYADTGGIFRNLDFGGFAFSDSELSRNVFYRFHDVWTAIGWRIGLIPLIVYFAVIFIGRSDNDQLLLSLVAGMSVICAFYSPAGLVVSSAFIAVVKGRREIS